MAIAILILVLVVFGLSFLCANLYAYWKKADKDRAEAKKSKQEWEVFGLATKEENDALAKYRSISEIELHIQKLEEEAVIRLASVNTEIEQKEASLREAEEKATAEVRNRISQMEKESEANLVSINSELIKKQSDLKHAEELLIATRNITEGYGNEYLVPKEALFDQMADQYGHEKAGVMLKEARDITRKMIRDGSSASSEIIDPHQNEAAKDFIVDAFNGRVEGILAKAKRLTENYGVLRQQIIDSHNVVNESGRHVGTAITEQFLKARLEELKWAVKVQEIIEEEKEEQRILKDQQRDEALAQREIEKAQKEVQKKLEEDERVRKIANEETEKVRQALLNAKDSERSALMEKLKEAEERAEAAEEQFRLSQQEKERAKSLAQQTKRGKVYIISNVGSFGEGVFKVGMTRRSDHEERIKELGDASVPFEFDVHAIIQSDNVPELEKSLHRNLAFYRVNKSNWRKEFFKITIDELISLIKQEGHETSWTMKAKALQFRETKEIERRIGEDASFRDAWVSRQAKLDLREQPSEPRAAR